MRAALFKSVQDPGLWMVPHTQECVFSIHLLEVLSGMYQEHVPMVTVNQGKLALRLTIGRLSAARGPVNAACLLLGLCTELPVSFRAF